MSLDTRVIEAMIESLQEQLHKMKGSALLANGMPSKRRGRSLLIDDIQPSIGAGKKHHVKKDGGLLLAGVALAGSTKGAKKPKTVKSSRGDGGKALSKFLDKLYEVRRKNPSLSYREAQKVASNQM